MKKIITIVLILVHSACISQDKNEVYDTLVAYGIQHPDIVMKQVILETGHLKCTNCSLDHNNIFGFRYEGKYLEFDHWTDGVDYMKDWQIRKGYVAGEDYYKFLDDVGYATSPTYIDKVKEITWNK